jgi:PBP1b-binding outer membrane lipoprotein LpoB
MNPVNSYRRTAIVAALFSATVAMAGCSSPAPMSRTTTTEQTTSTVVPPPPVTSQTTVTTTRQTQP